MNAHELEHELIRVKDFITKQKSILQNKETDPWKKVQNTYVTTVEEYEAVIDAIDKSSDSQSIQELETLEDERDKSEKI